MDRKPLSALQQVRGAMDATDEQLGVVFVHGFRSSAAMWDPFRQLITHDPDLAFVASLPFEYATTLVSLNPLRRIPAFDDAADMLRQFLEEGQAAGFQRLALVSHSQGGLVIQRYLARMLSEGRGQELTRIRRIVLFACPNTGSSIGLLLRRWGLPFNPQERQLRPFDRQVNDAHRIVINQVVHASPETTASSCRLPIAVYAGAEDRVVLPASARSVFPIARDLPGDHFTIVRPDSYQHPSYGALKAHLQLANDKSGPPVETLETIAAATLGVHNAVAPGDDPGSSSILTPYLPRAHDGKLYDVLAPALGGGPSALAVLTGDSSTGKTRALYEALLDLAPTRPFLRPATAGDLLTLIEEGRITAGTVLWLNEAQRFLDGSTGEEAAARLRALLERQPGVVAVGALWTEPYWRELTDQGLSRDPHSQARTLLTGPFTQRIPVASELSVHERERWSNLVQQSGDARLAHALKAGASDGRVVQQLSGGPELLTAYLHGPGTLFTHTEHALLTAALDARRLGHYAPLPVALLAHAADGALTPRHHSPDPAWADHALHALSTGARADGTRTDIRRTLTPLTALRTRSGAPARYEPAGYLDQHTRTRRAEQLGTPSLWDALTAYTTDPNDLNRLTDAAWNRGLYKQAVQLGRKAVLAGHPDAHVALLQRLTGQVGAVDPHHLAAQWVAIHADLTNPNGSAALLEELRAAGTDPALTALMDRDPAAHADLTDPRGVALLLMELWEAGEGQAVTALMDRDPAAHADLTDPRGVALLVQVLRVVGEEQAVTALTDRDPAAHADLTDPRGVAMLVQVLQGVDPERALLALLDRDFAAHVADTRPNGDACLLEELREAYAALAALLSGAPAANADLTDPNGIARLVEKLRRADVRHSRATAGARRPTPDQAVGALLDGAAAHADLTNPYGIAWLLEELRRFGAEQAVRALLNRDPAAHVVLTDPNGVARLLGELREAGAEQAVRALLNRDPAAHVVLTDPNGVARLLGELREAGAEQAVRALLNRDPAAHITDASKSDRLMRELRKAGDEQAADTLARRAANAGGVTAQLHRYGRETDGRPAAPWTWSDIPFPH
ncbi:hypothetical protein [Streptomyces lutosisoli]|uniref:hypothetical protein n=1 Tax=Streptomyces lutosisoli TaxID=2665721 RepID=UPI00360EBE11